MRECMHTGIELEMITADQLKEIQERKDALRRYL